MKKFLSLCLAAFILGGCGDDAKSESGANSKSAASQSQNADERGKGNRIGGEDSASVPFTPFKTGERLTLKSVVGGEVTIERTEKGFKLADSDKILMFDIFGTYCQPCRIEAPHLMDFQLKNSADFLMVGLIYFEDITDAQVIENFTKKFNAYYFIANSKQNERIVGQILSDIDYRHALSIPFKVMFKDGKYQRLTDINEGDERGKPYYLGMVSADVIKSDFARIKNGQ